MANNIAVSITADVADLTVKRAIMSAELKTAQKDLRDFAKTASTSGNTAELRTSMLATGNAVAKASYQIKWVDNQLKSLAQTAPVAGEAMNALGHGSSTVTRELLVLMREAARGNFTRMAGSATILAGALGLMTPEILTAAGAIAAGIAPIAAYGAAYLSAADDEAKFRNATQLTANYAGVSSAAFEDMAQRVAGASNTGIGAARTNLLSLVSSGRFTSEEVEQLGRDIAKFSQLTGQKTKEILAAWIKMAEGPTHYAEEFNRTYGALSLAQIQHIADLEKEGKKAEATAELIKDLTHWLDNQTAHLGPASDAWHGLATAMDDAWEAFKRSTGEGGALAEAATVNATGSTAMLDRRRAALAATATAEKRSADASAAAARVQAEGLEAYEKSHETLLSLRSSALNARDAVADLHREMAARVKANPNDAEAKDYYAHQAKFDAALLHKTDPSDNKKPKAPKDDQVAQWRADLQKQQDADNDFFKSDTADELAFWEDKLALTKGKATEQLAVETEIHNLRRQLAHETFSDQMGVIESQAARDKDNWTSYRADLQAELDLAKASKNAEAIRAANEKIETAEREHQEKMVEIQDQAAERALKALKENLDTQASIRKSQTDAAKERNTDQAKSSPLGPFGEVQAQQKNAALDRQNDQQAMADLQTLAATTLATDQGIIDRKAALYKGDVTKYQDALQQKTDDEQAFANKVAQLNAQMAAQQEQDYLKMKQAWTQAITPMVDSFGNGVKGMIEGTENLRTALRGVADTILGEIIGAIERWIVEQIVLAIMGADTSGTKAQVQAAAGLAGANGVASFAAAPFPLDMAAPAFGAAMEAAALGFGAFDKGMDVVPNDMVAMIHAGERIVPAADNRAIMSAIANDNGPRGGGGEQHDHYHYSPKVEAGVGQDVMGQLRAHENEFVRMMQGLHRNRRFG